jgi:putative sterol carrier protein
MAGIDPSQISPEEFAGLVATADDDQIKEVISGVGTDSVLDRIFEGMQASFRPDRAQGVDANVQFVITDDDTEHPYKVVIASGSCTAGRGEVDDPKVRLQTDIVSFAKLVGGKAEGPQLFMRGKLKVKGDIMFATRVMSFFDRPKPAE